MKKSILVCVLLLVSASLGGCASVPMSSAADDAQAKQFQSVPDKAVLYVYRNESMGAAVKMDVSVDGVHEGKTASKTYFRFVLSPGRHTITSESENTDNVFVDMQAGQEYYVWQEVKMGVLYARTKLHIVEAGEGQPAVQECKLIAASPTPDTAAQPTGAPSAATAPARHH